MFCVPLNARPGFVSGQLCHSGPRCSWRGKAPAPSRVPLRRGHPGFTWNELVLVKHGDPHLYPLASLVFISLKSFTRRK